MHGRDKGERSEERHRNRNGASVTLWDRVQTVLHNSPTVVVILLLVVCADGVKTIFDAYHGMREITEEYDFKRRVKTSLLPCSRTGNIKSRRDVAAEETSLTFFNSSRNRLAISWIDENGVPIDSKELQPGERLDLDSYPAHVFILSDPNRGCLSLVVKGTAPSVVERTDDHLEARIVEPTNVH